MYRYPPGEHQIANATDQDFIDGPEKGAFH
jgi:hypothetical protein